MVKQTDLTPDAIEAQNHLLGSIGMNEAIRAARSLGVSGDLNPVAINADSVVANIAGQGEDRQIG